MSVEGLPLLGLEIVIMDKRKKLIVIGGGAAGFFCAVNAARISPNLDVLILEKTSKLLSKVRISGGGRCNVTHQSEVVEDMIDAYPRGKNFVKKTFHQFSALDTLSWFNDRGVAIKAEPDGRMFPVTDQSETIIHCLLAEAEKFGVRIRLQSEVVSISRKNDFFELTLSDLHKATEVERSDFICVSVGGYPKESGFDWLKNIGHHVSPPVPSLFTFNIPDKVLHQLMGVANKDTFVKIPALKMQERGPLLITHWGMSGPAVLKLSSRAAKDLHALDYRYDIIVSWVPAFHESAMLEKLKSFKVVSPKQLVHSRSPFELIARLWTYLLLKSHISPELTWANITNTSLVTLSKSLCNDLYSVEGKTTFKDEFVTAGGIKLEEINPATMESRKVSGLFFAGEVMDVDGITGGYNFQHAWSSGWIAANAISKGTN